MIKKEITYKDLINEWFASLDKGYATPPYSKEEWTVLETLRSKYEVILEAEPEKPNKETEKKPDERFVAKTANFMDSPQAFSEYIIENYTAGTTIPGIELVFQDLVKLSDDKFQDVAKIINSGTNRNPGDGSFGMGDNEKLLYTLLKKHVNIPGGNVDELFLAIIMSGRVKGTKTEDSTDITANIEIDGTKGILHRNIMDISDLDLATMSTEAVSALDDIFEMSKIVLDQENDPEMQRDKLNDTFRLISDPGIIEEIEQLLQMYQTTDMKILQRLGKTVSNILSNKSPQDLVAAFFTEFDSFIRTVLSKVDYWSTIDPNKYTVFIEPSSDIYEMLKSDTENKRISKAVKNLSSYVVTVSGEAINKKLVA